jgi:hypothetical protein
LCLDDTTDPTSVEGFLRVTGDCRFAVSMFSAGPIHLHYESALKWLNFLPCLTLTLPSVAQWDTLHLFSNHPPVLQGVLNLLMALPTFAVSALSLTLYDYLAPRGSYAPLVLLSCTQPSRV